jgi:hypothetical protein
LVTGLFDADRMDFLARDAYHGGTREYGTMDLERLRTTLYFDHEGKIAIPWKTIPALRNMLLARLQMYETCYFHPRVRAFEVAAEDLMAKTLQVDGFSWLLSNTQFLEKYRALDDHWVYGIALSWAKEPKGTPKHNLSASWIRLFDRHKEWECAREIRKRVDDEFVELLTSAVPEVETKLVEILEKWRTDKVTPEGKHFPSDVTAPIGHLVHVDAPSLEGGLGPLFEETGPYVLLDAEGQPREDSTGRRVLKQLAGVNLVFLRFMTVGALVEIVREAVEALRQKFPFLKPEQ